MPDRPALTEARRAVRRQELIVQRELVRLRHSARPRWSSASPAVGSLRSPSGPPVVERQVPSGHRAV